ncbi:MAG: ATP-dependent protease ATPase subunit HslU [Deltaproteobacteria bacterium]|nr:ATP-dependent protease ATPase subunit HslU [Deltaproteobacteria bacterium]
MPLPLTPRETVVELDRYIIGQKAAKRAVAVALRNRWRRQQAPADIRDEIAPKNIILIGPTGVGKTEIARRMARLVQAPFVKVEASKFTEVGYVGRDVDSMVRDLVEASLKLVREEAIAAVKVKAEQGVEERILDRLLPGKNPSEPGAEDAQRTREKLRQLLRTGALDDRVIELDIASAPVLPQMQMFSAQGMEEMVMNLQEVLGSSLGGKGRTRRRKLTVKEAREALVKEESDKLLDLEQVQRDAVKRAEESGIIFIDEIDKIAGREKGMGGPDVSREGVQRDLLPVVEGSAVTTKYGVVRTDHVLFIASGAFHVAKVTDLIPELQGRFPIRVELDSLGEEEFVHILTEPRNSLVRQYTALLAAEEVDVQWEQDGIREIARVAAEVNRRQQNIGARRLHTVMERLLEEVSFLAPEMRGARVVVNAALVKERLQPLLESEDLGRYVL